MREMLLMYFWLVYKQIINKSIKILMKFFPSVLEYEDIVKNDFLMQNLSILGTQPLSLSHK